MKNYNFLILALIFSSSYGMDKSYLEKFYETSESPQQVIKDICETLHNGNFIQSINLTDQFINRSANRLELNSLKKALEYEHGSYCTDHLRFCFWSNILLVSTMISTAIPVLYHEQATCTQKALLAAECSALGINAANTYFAWQSYKDYRKKFDQTKEMLLSKVKNLQTLKTMEILELARDNAQKATLLNQALKEFRATLKECADNFRDTHKTRTTQNNGYQ